MKHVVLFFLLIFFGLNSYAQDKKRMADREFNHFGELVEQTKESKEADSLLYIHNHQSGVEGAISGFSCLKGYADDNMQYLYGGITWHEGKSEIIVCYFKYDKNTRKIVAISKQPIP
jgi:hypothetical protein